MSRPEILQVALDEAKGEYERTQTRIALVETKAQLVSATVGILLTFFVVIPTEHIPHSRPEDGLLLIMAVGALVLSLILSIAASLLVEVISPCQAAAVCSECERLLGDVGAAADPNGEELVRNVIGSYLVSSAKVAELLAKRMLCLRSAQISLVMGILFTIILVGLPYLAEAVALLNA